MYNNESTIEPNSAASIVSEGSIGSSAGGEAAAAAANNNSQQFDYLRLKAEFKKLQNHFEVCVFDFEMFYLSFDVLRKNETKDIRRHQLRKQFVD